LTPPERNPTMEVKRGQDQHRSRHPGWSPRRSRHQRRQRLVQFPARREEDHASAAGGALPGAAALSVPSRLADLDVPGGNRPGVALCRRTPEVGPGPGTALKVGILVGLLMGVPDNMANAAWGTS